jgi:membrane associated rhomboid family serine protease
VLGAIVSLLLLARVIEPVYGSTEFLKFILVAQLAAGTATFVLAYLVFILAPQQFKGKTL